jgi:hypothetical protein
MPDNEYGRGGRLRREVASRVERERDAIRRAIDREFEAHGTDRLADREAARTRVLQLLAERAADYVAKPGFDDPTGRRILKIIAAFTAYDSDRGLLVEVLNQLLTGATREFPYVPKFVSSLYEPRPTRFRARHDLEALDCTQELKVIIPGIEHAAAALQRYAEKRGLLATYINEDKEVAEELKSNFAQLPHLVSGRPGGVLGPKREVLAVHRRRRFSMPDGVVCALALTIALESILRQAVRSAKLGEGKNLRPHELASRLEALGVLTAGTTALLRDVFPGDAMGIRDGLVHGAFFADDEHLLERTVAGLGATVRSLVADLRGHGLLDAMSANGPWTIGLGISDDHVKTIATQYGPGLNLGTQQDSIEGQKVLFRVLTTYTPDKRLLGQSSFLLSVRGSKPNRATPEEALSALLGGVVVLEELMRATAELHQIPTLRTERQPSAAVRCELAMMEDRPGGLISDEVLKQLFPDCPPELRASFHAVRAVRDALFHGVWKWPVPTEQVCHLIAKLMLSLASAIDTVEGSGA